MARRLPNGFVLTYYFFVDKIMYPSTKHTHTQEPKYPKYSHTTSFGSRLVITYSCDNVTHLT